MIVAIDECGSFAPESSDLGFFVAVHLRQRKTLLDLKRRQFLRWEQSLPSSLKNAKGEIKSPHVADDDLLRFAREVVRAHPVVRISPYSMRGIDNPLSVVEKHRAVTQIGVSYGVALYQGQGKLRLGLTVKDLGNWYKNLSYDQYMKTRMLGGCVYRALVNSIGHSISGGYDKDELPRLRYKIDRDFIKEPRHLVFWKILLRNQIWQASKVEPLPMLNEWDHSDHPFTQTVDGETHARITEIFEDRCEFLHSHEHFEIRIADAVASIMHRFWNKRQCSQAYRIIVGSFCGRGSFPQIVLNDFDLAGYRYDPSDNPWAEGGKPE